VRRLVRTPLAAAGIIIAPFAAALWITGCQLRMAEHLADADLDGATALTIISALCFILAVRRNREKLFMADMIVKQHAQATRLAARQPTVPFQADDLEQLREARRAARRASPR